MTCAVDPSGGLCTTSGATVFTYDPDGRRVTKAQGNGTLIEDEVYDLQGNQTSAHNGSTVLRSEVYAPGSWHLGTYTGTTLNYTHTDWLGSLRLVSNGESCLDDPFGMTFRCVNGTDVTPMKYTGKQHDSETGLDEFGARYYAATRNFGRFMTPDPHSGTLLHALNPQRWNRYAYAVNNPVAFVDPDGRDAIAVNFTNLAGGFGHWAIISVNRNGSASFSEFGPRGGGKPIYPGQYTTYSLRTNVSVGSNGVPTQETLKAVQAELALDEHEPEYSISLAYYKTSDDETASLNAYIAAAEIAQSKREAPLYFVGINDCRDYCLGGLHAAGVETSHYANLNLGPNFLFRFLQANADATYNKPRKPKEVVTSRICPLAGCGK